LLIPSLGAAGSRSAEIFDSMIKLAGLPLLFADDSGISSREGVVRTLHPARTRAEPVIQPDRPWEGDRVYIYGSVYFDSRQRRYVMWYFTRPGLELLGSLSGRGSIAGLRHDGFDLTLYATSADGLNWEKPDLGRYDYRGSRNNNIIFDVTSPSVLWDRAATDPASRYKMLGSLPEGYRAAVSADGIVWREPVDMPVLEHVDTITLARDPRTGDYLAYHKRPAEVRGFQRRVVWLSRSADFATWSAPELVLVPDAFDDQWVTQAQERTEIYNMSVYPHAAGFIGFPAMFRVQTERARETLSPGQSPVDGPIDLQLATSPDGRTWHRSNPRTAMVPRGAPGTFDAGALLGCSSTLVHTDKETWLYYTAISTGHGGPLPAKRITIGRAEWRRHGFVSLDAGPDGGEIVTRPLQIGAGALRLNADAARGEVAYALTETDGRAIPGFDFADCTPLRADEVAAPLRWKNGTALPQDRPVVLRLRLKNTRLYSVEQDGA
jgi:hypothetical protein